MYVVHFFENRKELLNQLRQQIPTVGDDVKIKGWKGKVIKVVAIDEKTFHVQLALESKTKPVLATDPGKKKKR